MLTAAATDWQPQVQVCWTWLCTQSAHDSSKQNSLSNKLTAVSGSPLILYTAAVSSRRNNVMCGLWICCTSHTSILSMNQSRTLACSDGQSQNSRLWYLSTSKNDVTTTRLANLRPARLCWAFWLSSTPLNSTNICTVNNSNISHCDHNRYCTVTDDWSFPIQLNSYPRKLTHTPQPQQSLPTMQEL